MLRVALLGAGRIAHVHAANIHSNKQSELVAVADINTDAASKLANKYDAKTATTEEIFADESIHAVLIASSTNTHSELIEMAYKAGKAILCEKPVDLSLERAIICKNAVADSDSPIMVGFNRRFDPHFSSLKAAFDAAEIGKGELLCITSYDPAPPPVAYIKVSGGLFRDMMIHDFDVACWIFGSLPTSIVAMGSSIVNPEIGEAEDFDTAVVSMTWADGRIAVIKNSRRAAYGYDQRIELLGEKGQLNVKNVRENTVEKITSDGSHTAKPEYFFLERYTQAFVSEWDAFATSALKNEAPPVNLQDGINALILAEAATLSAQSGKMVHINGEQITVES